MVKTQFLPGREQSNFSKRIYKIKIIRFIALAYAFYIGIGVSVTSIHWFSEFVAGATIGSVIGVVVGKSYLAERN